MKNKTQITHWLVDAALLLGFLLAFFLDLTGLALHQWLGVFLGVLAVYHLLRHKDWVSRTLERFLHPLSWRVRVYAWLDLGILLGFNLMIGTGLAMSTWFNLPLANYTAWLDLHVVSSVTTLLAVVAKLALHWRWIVITYQKMTTPADRSAALAPRPVAQPVAASQPRRVAVPQPAALTGPQMLSRRQFLTTMGFVGAGAALALSNLIGRSDPVSSQSLDGAGFDSPTASPTAAPTTPPVAAATATSQPAAPATLQPTAAPTAVPTAQPTAYACTYRCRKGRHCAFPGDCRSYTDQNNNGYCDLGECS